MALMDTVKKYPLATAGVVLVVGLILVLALSGGSSEGGGTTVVAQPNNDAANTINGQIAQAQIAGQVQALGIDAQKSVALDANEKQLTLGRLQIEGMNNQNILAAAVAYGEQKMVTIVEETRAKRDVDITNINAARDLSLNAQNVSVQQSKLNFDYQLGLAQMYSTERLGAATLGTQAGIELAKIGSNERLGAAALNIGAVHGLNIGSSVSSVQIGIPKA